jgi:hypothetical protein
MRLNFHQFLLGREYFKSKSGLKKNVAKKNDPIPHKITSLAITVFLVINKFEIDTPTSRLVIKCVL